MVTASTPGTARSRSTSARCDCLPRASSYPARLGSTSTSNPPSRRNPGSAVAAETALIRNSPPEASRRSESATWPITRALPMLMPPGRRRSSPTCRLRSLTAARPVNAQAGQAPKISVAARLNPIGPDEHAPVELELGEAQGDGQHGMHRRQQRVGRPHEQEQSGSASGQREEQPFGEQLSGEAPSAATQ